MGPEEMVVEVVMGMPPQGIHDAAGEAHRRIARPRRGSMVGLLRHSPRFPRRSTRLQALTRHAGKSHSGWQPLLGASQRGLG